MLVFHEAYEVVSNDEKTCIAIGNFDGVHSGHRILLEKTVSYSITEKLTSVVYTFSPHPVELISPTKKVERLTTLEEKLSIFESLGIHSVLIQKFDYDFANISAETFFKKFLIETLHAKRINVGFNFSFGKYKEGNLEKLKSFCLKYDVSLHIEQAHKCENKIISSSLIRQSLKTGELLLANAMLGYPYKLDGVVGRGTGIGQKIGFPTANLKPPPEKLIPQTGVYFTKTVINGETFKSVTNIGVRPTFKNIATSPIVETHIIDFSGNLYDREITVEFYERIRDEIKFDDVTKLVSRIREDVEYSKKKAFN